MKTRPIFAAILTVVAVLAVASSAWADPGNGATKVNQEFCNITPFGSNVCFDYNYVVNTTTTPSGNVSFVTNGKNLIVNNTASGCTFTGQSAFHDHYLLKDGVLHEQGSHEDSSLTQQCGTLQQKCTFTRQAHYANGVFQYDRPEFVCVPL